MIWRRLDYVGEERQKTSEQKLAASSSFSTFDLSLHRQHPLDTKSSEMNVAPGLQTSKNHSGLGYSTVTAPNSRALLTSANNRANNRANHHLSYIQLPRIRPRPRNRKYGPLLF